MKELTLERIEQIFEMFFENRLRGPTKESKYSLVRKAFCILAKKHTDFSLSEIGRHLGFKHDTVLYHCHETDIFTWKYKELAQGFRDAEEMILLEKGDMNVENQSFVVMWRMQKLLQ